MEVLILTGSPHEKGSTALLAEKFCAGAQEAGHHITRFDTAKMNINPCHGCLYCKSHDQQCIQKDDMQAIYQPLLTADVVVFVTPLYYFGIAAQLKAAIDRFYAVNPTIKTQSKKAVLLAACGGEEDGVMDSLVANYKAILHYLKWQDIGMVLATGAHSKTDIENGEFPKEAKKLGLTIK